jgi:hypothetical protein
LKDAHVLIHLVKCAVGLLEEVEDNTSAEISLIFIVVHLEDLLKGCDIDVVAKVGESDGTVLVLLMYALASRDGWKMDIGGMYLDLSCRHVDVGLMKIRK